MSVLSSIVTVSQSTINHRRLVYNAYKDGHLAQMLGLDPPTGPLSSQPTSEVQDEYSARRLSAADRKKRADIVADAWGQADMAISSDDERPRKRKAARDESEESETRYHVSRRKHGRNGDGSRSYVSPRKRRRTALEQDVHQAPAVSQFVSSSDEDGVSEREGGEEEGEIVEKRKPLSERIQLNLVSDDDLDEIERTYKANKQRGKQPLLRNGSTVGKREDRNGQEAKLKSEERRAYWASKSLMQSNSGSE